MGRGTCGCVREGCLPDRCQGCPRVDTATGQQRGRKCGPCANGVCARAHKRPRHCRLEKAIASCQAATRMLRSLMEEEHGERGSAELYQVGTELCLLLNQLLNDSSEQGVSQPEGPDGATALATFTTTLLADPYQVAAPARIQPRLKDGQNTWGRVMLSRGHLGPDYVGEVVKAAMSASGAPTPADRISEDAVGARAAFETAFHRLTGGRWRVGAVYGTASDAVNDLLTCAANQMSRKRGGLHEEGHIIVIGGCWAAGRGRLSFVSRRMRNHHDAEPLWPALPHVHLRDIPLIDKTHTFGPPTAPPPFTPAERRMLTEVVELITANTNVGAVLVEPYMIPGGGRWIHPEAYKELRRACRRSRVAFVVDETLAFLRTGRLFSHEWYMEDARGMGPDGMVFGKGMQASGVAFPTLPADSSHEGLRWYENVTAAGDELALLRGAAVVNTIMDKTLHQEERLKRLHDAAVEVLSDRSPESFWGGGLIWYRYPEAKHDEGFDVEINVHEEEILRAVLPIDWTVNDVRQYFKCTRCI